MPTSKHKALNIKDELDIAVLQDELSTLDPNIIALDTETTGLNIILDKPFLIQLGFKYDNNGTPWYYTYTIDVEKYPKLTDKVLTILYNHLDKGNKALIGHNLKFDLHMLENIKMPYKGHVRDTMINIRFAHDALAEKNGGPPLGLKEYTAKYIDGSAKDYDRLIQSARSELSKEYNMNLIKILNKYPVPKGKRKWTLAYVADLLDDAIVTVEELPSPVREAYTEWYNSLPRRLQRTMLGVSITKDTIPYDMIDRELVTKYGHLDIVYTLQVYYSTIRVIKNRLNYEAYLDECANLQPCYSMERVGFKLDFNYLEKVQVEMKDYIIYLRNELNELAQQELHVGQHTVIKQIIKDIFNVDVSETNAGVLKDLKEETKDENLKRFLAIILELRSLEKWYSTYLLRYLKQKGEYDRAHTSINLVGAITGRVTSDFQQFPKYGILKEDGTELFNPRRMVLVDKDKGFVALAYLDYSQIELRFTVQYTIAVGNPDLNLSRAYMPYKCYKYVAPDEEVKVIPFDFNNREHIKHAYTWKWVHEEDHTPWHELDVHAATTKVAYPHIDPASDEFKKLRGKVGKPVNFAKNFGAQFNRIKQMFPDMTDEEVRVIDEAYYKAFPGIKTYHDYCRYRAQTTTSTVNLYGFRYYGLNGHKLTNALIQGSAAFYLKKKIREVAKFLEEGKYKSRLQMTIHDELSFELYNGEEFILEKIKEIMEDAPELQVPIVAELEITTTNWAEKTDKFNSIKEAIYG